MVKFKPSGSNFKPSNFKLSPNPATTEVQVWIENLGEKSGELTVIDAQGRRVWQQTIDFQGVQQTQHLNISTFAPGLYFVTLRSEGAVLTKRLAVNR